MALLSFKTKKEPIDVSLLVKRAREYADQIISDTVKSSLIKAASQAQTTAAASSSDIKYSERDIPVDELIKVEKSFVEKLIELIRQSGMTDPEIYKAAGLDRRLFSKIMSDSGYKPSKDTCIALALALKLNQYQTNDLLERAGYILSHSIRRDLIIEYMIINRIFDIDTVNAVLDQSKEKILGK